VNAFIVGSGTCLPNNVKTNDQLAPVLGLDPEQIFKSSGIRNRRWVEPGTTTSSLAKEALSVALDDAQISAEQVDYLLFGTMTPDRLIPGSAAAVQKSLGLREIPCLDIRATCCNALYALQLAQGLIASGAARVVAICLAEVQSPWLDLSAKSSGISMLFGDGAAALIVSAEKRQRALEVLDVVLATDGSFVDDLGVRCPGTEFGTSPQGLNDESDNFFPRMNGQSVILQASRKMTASCKQVLERNQLATQDIKWIVPHQANLNLLRQVARTLAFPPERVVTILEDLGNTSSASMGIALDTLRRSESLVENDYLLLPAFGAGFTWGAGLCRA